MSKNGLPCEVIVSSMYVAHSPKLTASLPLKISRNPKRKSECLPTINFQVLLLLVSGREGNLLNNEPSFIMFITISSQQAHKFPVPDSNYLPYKCFAKKASYCHVHLIAMCI